MQAESTGPRLARVAAVAGIAVFALVLLVLVLGGGGAYTITARFTNAGQVVPGGLVQIAGRSVGKIDKLSLSDNGLADVKLKITDDDFTPLHRGTIARIRAVGLVSVSNRVIELSPGPATADEIPDGGVLSTDETRGIVDLDAVLDDLDPKTRTELQSIIRDGAKIYAGSTEQANLAFHYLSPALSQTAALSRELATDRAALRRLIGTAADVATALASRRGDIEQGINSTAVTLSAIASERAALEDSLVRAPAVLVQGRGTLARTRTTLEVARPALRDLSRAAPSLARLLRVTVPAAQRATPVIKTLRNQLPAVRRSLVPLPGLARVAIPALQSATKAIHDNQGIFAGLRAYSPDLVNGFFNGFGGVTSLSYDANGHFARISAHGGRTGITALAGLPGVIPAINAGVLADPRTGVSERCPGSAAEPAPDSSNPFVPDPSLCDQADNKR